MEVANALKKPMRGGQTGGWQKLEMQTLRVTEAENLCDLYFRLIQKTSSTKH